MLGNIKALQIGLFRTSASGSVITRRSFCAGSPADGTRNISKKAKFIRHPWLQDKLPYVKELSDETRLLTFLAANTAAGNLSNVERDWCYLPEGLQGAAFEVLFQTIMYAGVPKVLNALAAISELNGGELYKSCLEKLAVPEIEESPEKTMEKGEQLMKTHYSHRYQRLRERMTNLHPSLDAWLVEFMYGRARGRSGFLTQRERQLCALSAMAGQIVSQQFRSTIMSALNDGSNLEEVRGVLDHTALVWGESYQSMVDALWADLNKRRLVSLQKVATPTNPSQEKKSLLNTQPKGIIYKAPSHHPLIPFYRPVPTLSDSVRVLSLLAGNASTGNLTGVARDWSYLPEEYHSAGLEILLQTVVFAGFQKTINALSMVHDVGVSPSALKQLVNIQCSTEQRNEAGENLLKIIYRNQYGKLREKLRSHHPALEKLIVEFAYGTVLARECAGITPRERELCALMCLTGQTVFPQFHSHLLGALNTGATMDEVRGILDQTEHVWGKKEQAMVDGFWLDFVYQTKRAKANKSS